VFLKITVLTVYLSLFLSSVLKIDDSPYLLTAQVSDSKAKIAETLVRRALRDTLGYHFLRELTELGHRLPGSKNAAKAVRWAQLKMEELDLDSVWLQSCSVPQWERGDIEEALLYNHDGVLLRSLSVASLGTSIGTDREGITAEVLEVKSFEELHQKKERAVGKIIFFNRPLDPGLIETFSAYGRVVNQRTQGAVEAGKAGAVAAIVRSVTTKYDNVPHVGIMHYKEDVQQVPALTIGLKDADFLSSCLEKHKTLKIHLRLDCRNLPETTSYNVIGQLTGKEYPDEVIVIGGHFDCWDKGIGAQDDGGGCIQCLEVLTLFQRLGIQPKRTVRAVFYMNEEMGLSGANVYGEWSAVSGEKHIAGIESDRGVHTPRGFYVNSDPRDLSIIQSWLPLLQNACIEWIRKGGSGGDVGRIKNARTLIGFVPDIQRYFDFHHSANDVFSAVHPREMELGTAAMAILVYMLSEEF